MALLSTIDFIVIAAYFVAVILFGYLASRRETKEGYLIADRKLGVLSSLATINATKTGSILIVFTAFVYLFGFSAIWYFIGASVGYLVFTLFAVKLKKESKKYYTLADYFYFNYGKLPAAFATIVNIIVMFGFLVVNLIGGAKIFSIFTGWSFWISAIIISTVVLIYLLMGGFKAVVYTDIIQYIGIVVIIILLAIVLTRGIPVGSLDWNFFSAGATTIAGFLIIGLLIPFASPDLWQRVYSAKDSKTVKKSIIYSVAIYFAVCLALAIIALAVKALLPQLDPDTALIYGFAKLLAPGVAGLAIVLLFAAIMSSIDTYAFTTSSAIIQDFFKKLRKRETVKSIKITLTVVLIIGTLVGILLQGLLISTYIFTGFIIVLAIPTLMTWFRKKVSNTTLNITFIIGFIGITYFLATAFPDITPSLVPRMIGVSIAGIIIGSIVSKIVKRRKPRKVLS